MSAPDRAAPEAPAERAAEERSGPAHASPPATGGGTPAGDGGLDGAPARRQGGGPVDFLRQVGAVLRKDLLAELRSGEVLLSMLLFSVLVVLVFAFAFVRGGAPLPDVAAGILWVSLAFAGTLGLSRAWDREREADGLRALLLSPASRNALYVGKVVGLFLFLALTALAVAPLVGLLFQVPLFNLGGRLLVLLGLGLYGFAVLGGFFGALMAKSRARDLLLFIVLYPLLMPLFIGGVMGTAQIFAEHPNLQRLEFFTTLLVVFDTVMSVVALWSFERLVTD